ncbi:MAG: 4-hydroxythreonine-4-phosphate dehydrogenase PdxA, partial [Burkholderiaceae bacterium]
MTARPIVITLGDPAGIGPEIIVKAFRDAPELLRGCFVAGNLGSLRRATQVVAGENALAMPVGVIESPEEASTVPPRC